MDTETRTAIGELGAETRALREVTNALGTDVTGLRAEVRAGFARMDRYFELAQAQHLDLCRSIDERFAEARREMTVFRSEMAGFRDWTVVQFADLRQEVRELRTWVSDLADRV